MENHFDLRWKGSSSVLDYQCDSSDPYIVETTGGVVTWNEEEEKEVLAGRFEALFLEVDMAGRKDVNLFSIIDCSMTIQDDVWLAFFSESNRKSDPDWSALEGDLLIINDVSILPAFRGRNLGLCVINRLMHLFGKGADLTVIRSTPPQFRKRFFYPEIPQWWNLMKFDEFSKDEATATENLSKLYKKIGFMEIGGGHPFLARPMDLPLEDVKHT